MKGFIAGYSLHKYGSISPDLNSIVNYPLEWTNGQFTGYKFLCELKN